MSISPFPSHIFRKYDIRGVYGRELTEELAFRVGRALAGICRERRRAASPLVAVGMDARTHSPSLRDAFGTGVASAGGRWLDLGLCPAPLVYFCAFEKEVDGFAVVTASHNPPEDNGLKLGVGTETLHSDDISDIGRAVRIDGTAMPANGMEPSGRLDIPALYEKRMLFEFSGLRDAVQALKRPIRVVVDSGNGTAGVILPGILEKLGIKVRELFSMPDGTFPNHHPDPTLPEALEDLRREVLDLGADAGFAFDGDADRLGVLDERGQIIWGDMLLLILGRRAIEEWRRGGEEGNPPLIISEVKASSLLYDGIQKAGGRTMMFKTGHSLIKAKMRETGAVLAGEMSGHLFFADRYFGFDDALYGCLRLLEVYVEKILEEHCEGFSGLLAGLPKTVSTPEIRFPCEDRLKFAAVEAFHKKLRSHIAQGKDPKVVQIIDIDGVRVRFEKGWGLVRASNTQPVLVMRFEGTDQETVDVGRGFFEKLLKVVFLDLNR